MSKDEKKSITIISSIIVRPSEETPRETLWLSRLDMIRRQPYSHTHVLYIYQPNTTHDNNNNPIPSSTTFFDVDVLKESLSKALVPFYTMAGRVKVNESTGRYEIDCNAEGALFVEAETTNTIFDLGDELDPQNELAKCLSPSWDYSEGLSTIPLLMVQLTRFKCGSVCLGFSQHHHVADGTSHVHFIDSWARLTRGVDIIVPPVHDRLKYVAPRDPPQIKFLEHYTEPSLPPLDMSRAMTSKTIQVTFKFSKGQIDALEQEAMSTQEIMSYKLSSFTVLAGHLWRSACKARNLPKDQDVKIYIPVSGRSILNNPKLPLGYSGNAIVCTAAKAKAGDVMNKPLWYAVRKVIEAIAKMKDSECFRSAIDYIETRPSLEPLIRGEYNSTCPNLSINSWMKFGVDEIDFGWGGTKFIRHGGLRHEGQSVVMPSESANGGLLLSIRLFSDHMALFKKYIYEFGNIN